MPYVPSTTSTTWATSPSAANWPSANLALFVPLRLPNSTTIKRFWYISGNATGNVDIGLYDAAGNKIVSTGSTAQGTSNQIDFISVTSTPVSVGDYYLAIAYASTTATPFRATSPGVARYLGVVQMASALPLPTTATFAAAGQDYVPWFGFSTLASDL